MKNTKEWVIFGSSPQINDINDSDILELQKQFTTIGLNLFPNHYPMVDYWVYLDEVVPELIHKHITYQRIICHSDCFDENKKFGIEAKYFDTAMKNQKITKNPSALLGTYSVVIPAIHFAYTQGAEKVILVGVRLNKEWDHFYSTEKPTRNKNGLDVLPDYFKILGEHIRIISIDPQTPGVDFVSLKDILLKEKEN